MFLAQACVAAAFGATAPPPRKTVVAAADGTGDFRSLQAAVNALPENGGEIRIKPGTYREVVVIDKPHVRLVGDAKEPAKVGIVFNKSHASAGGTLASATVAVNADDFYAEGVTFANDYSLDKPLGNGSQAVALLIRGDRAVLRHVRLIGFQDTLYAGSKSCVSEQGPCAVTRQYFSDCYIEGNVDFIFGDSKAVFDHCEIHALPNKHYPDEPSGYVFDRCKITSSDGTPKIYLGRPWRAYSTVVFLNTDIEASIDPARRREWTPGETHKIDTSFYAEYNSRGLGGNASQRDPHAKQLQENDVEKYSTKIFLAGQDHWDATKVH